MRQLQLGADEAITAPGNRLDERRILTQRLSQQKDIVGQAAFFDECVGPERPDHLVLLKQVPAIPDQQVQRVESFRRDRHYVILAQQPALHGIEAEGPKFVEPQWLLAGSLFRNDGGIAESFRGGSVACLLAQSPSLDPSENSLRNL